MTINEAKYEDVLKIRHEAMYPDKEINFAKLPDDDKGIHLGAFDGSELVAVVSIFMHENRDLQFRKLATRPHLQKKGYATDLIKWLADYANDIKLNRLWCNAREEAVEFYKKHGFSETEEKFSKNGYNYVVMEKVFKEI